MIIMGQKGNGNIYQFLEISAAEVQGGVTKEFPTKEMESNQFYSLV